MRNGLNVLTSVELIAAQLAHGDDDVQALFFKAFVKECKSWDTHAAVEFQLASVNLKLTEEEIEVLSMLTYTEEDNG